MRNPFRSIQLLALCAGIAFIQTVSAEDALTGGSQQGAEQMNAKPQIETFGWYIAKQGMGQMKFSEAEKAAFLEGFKSGLADKRPIDSRQDELREMQEYFQGRMTDMRKQESEEQESKNKRFFEELANNENVQQSESGLYYEIIEPGDDIRATDEDKVTLHYHGTLVDGTVFDSSKERGEPATFPVAGVVPGFSEGVKLVGNGGKVKLYIPPSLGYGNNPGGRIPPNATLIFEVEMLNIDAADQSAPAAQTE